MSKPLGESSRNGSKLSSDMEQILEATFDIWEGLRGASIFLTGGTGFIGSWFLESLMSANEELGVNIRATILTRDLNRFRNKSLRLAEYPAFTFLAGDVRNFASPKGNFSHVIHAATDSSQYVNMNNPKLMYETIVTGTSRVLDFAVEKRSERVLLLSSGAIYGRQPDNVSRLREDYPGSVGLLDSINAYAGGKRGAETLAAIYEQQFGLQVVVARIFALMGPYLPLDIHYAAGNFIRDALTGKTLVVNGSGAPVRSYLYASDLMIWLWRMLLLGRSCAAYNVGSENEISILGLAELIASTIGNGKYCVLGKEDNGVNPGRYVPDTTLIRSELALREQVTLVDAIERTAEWYGWNGLYSRKK